MKTVRTRFAPSPTGYLHIGGARTALYCYLLAKKHNGQFILRVEDTDRERSTDEAIDAILQGMEWLGLPADEGPFFQTKRYDLYNKEIDRLIAEKKAYPCFCTPQELAVKREKAQAQKIKFKYDRTCWHLEESTRQQKLAENIPHCIRFLSDDEKDIVVKDLIKGEVVVSGKELDDLIIRRSDGNPTYNLTVVVDDADMKISHVIRGDDHLNNTFRQIQMYEALGYELPEFAHCSMILGDDKKKLSKRHGATSVMAYRDMGYLPHAVLNYLVRLGWSHEDKEVFTMDEMTKLFDLKNVSSSAAVFNTSKLDWLNGHYIREAKPEDLFEEVKWHLQRLGIENPNEDVLREAIAISQVKVKTLLELAEFIDLLFKDIPADESVIEKNINEKTKPILKQIVGELEKLTSFDPDQVKPIFEKAMADFEVGMGKVANPVRVALSGKKISPGAFDLLKLMDRDKALAKLKSYL